MTLQQRQEAFQEGLKLLESEYKLRIIVTPSIYLADNTDGRFNGKNKPSIINSGETPAGGGTDNTAGSGIDTIANA